MERQLEPSPRKLTAPTSVPSGGTELHRTGAEAAAQRRPETEPEEALVVDARSNFRPAQMVERKLASRLGRGALPASHVRTTAMLAGRRRG
jgi:hypothetical protein